MKITAIKTFPVWVGSRNQMIVKVETDEGIYGLGEAGVSSRELAVEGAVKHFREFLIGRDPFQRGSLWQEMYRRQYFEGGRILTGAISAIDIALHDIVGKALGVPVYQLLGGKQRDFIPGFATATVNNGPELLDNVRGFMEKGWNVLRFFPSHPAQPGDDGWTFEPFESVGHTAGWMVKVREMVGSGPVLGIDIHHRYSAAETASFCQRMPPGTLDFLEEPIRAEAPEAYEALRKMVSIPFAIGEEFSSKWSFLPYIERGITNYARVDVSNVGGFSEAMKVAGWAEAHYIDLMPHNPLGPICTAASIHLAAAVANFAWLEIRVLPDGKLLFADDDLFPVHPVLQGCGFPVPDAPGLGVDFNEELATREAFRYQEGPRLHKRDGSFTNW